MLRTLCALLVLVTAAGTAQARRRPRKEPGYQGILEFAAGLPATIVENLLPELTYEPVEARRLGKARVLWYNVRRFEELGLPHPRGGRMTPRFEKALLDAFAYGIPQPEEPPELYTELAKTLYPDRYGGRWVGHYKGAARGAAAGHAYLKGTNFTPFRWGGAPPHHRGTESLVGAVVETIWGMVFNRSLPIGAVEPLVIIDRGDSNEFGPKMVVVRENVPRIGHYVSNLAELPTVDNARVEGALARLRAALPPGHLPVPASWRRRPYGAELYHHIHRVAHQHAAAYALRLFPGSPSESNTLVDGRFLDFSTSSSNRGYAPIKVLDFVNAFGDPDIFYEALIHAPFAHALRQWGSDPADREVPDVHGTFFATYEHYRRLEMLKLTGIPEEQAEGLLPAAGQLLDLMDRLAMEGTRKVNVRDSDMPESPGTYDLPAILVRAAEAMQARGRGADAAGLTKSLVELIPDAGLREAFAAAYRGLHAMALKRSGGPRAGFATYVTYRAQMLNRTLPRLYQRVLKQDSIDLSREYAQSGDPGLVRRFIEERVQEATRHHAGLRRGQVVVAVEHEPGKGLWRRLAFDMYTNRYVYQVLAEVQEGRVFVAGKWRSPESARRYQLRGHAADEVSTTVPSLRFEVPLSGGVEEGLTLLRELRLQPRRGPGGEQLQRRAFAATTWTTGLTGALTSASERPRHHLGLSRRSGNVAARQPSRGFGRAAGSKRSRRH
jgi:hypothetical protein